VERPAHADALAAGLLQVVGLVVGNLPETARGEMGFLLGTTRGCLDTDWAFDRSRREGARYASPAAFSRTLPSTLPAEAALRWRLTGPGNVVSAGEASAAAAVRRAAAWMRAMRLPLCIAGGFDLDPQEGPLAAVMLLAPTADAGDVGMVEINETGPVEFAQTVDVSLRRLAEGVRIKAGAALGAGVKLRASV
jgi:hypothetical protein